MLAVPAVVTQNGACISEGCYQFCSSAISVMLLSLRLTPRLWLLGLSFWCWFQWWFRTTFILFNTVLFWDLITKLLMRCVLILLQIHDGRGTWLRKIIQHFHDSCEENIVCEQRQSSQKPENFSCYIRDVWKWQVVSSATSGILTGNDRFLIGKKWPGERTSMQRAKEALQASADISWILLRINFFFLFFFFFHLCCRRSEEAVQGFSDVIDSPTEGFPCVLTPAVPNKVKACLAQGWCMLWVMCAEELSEIKLVCTCVLQL